MIGTPLLDQYRHPWNHRLKDRPRRPWKSRTTAESAAKSATVQWLSSATPDEIRDANLVPMRENPMSLHTTLLAMTL